MSEETKGLILADEQLCTLFPVFDPESDIYEAVAGATEPVTLDDFPTVRTPGRNTTMFTIEDFEGKHQVPVIKGILTHWCRHYVLWNHDGESTDSKIFAESYDGRKLYVVPNVPLGDLEHDLINEACDDDGSLDMSRLYYNQKGSSEKGGRLVQHRISMFILQPNRKIPIIVDAAPGSEFVISRTLKQMVPAHHRCIVEVTVDEVQGRTTKFNQMSVRKTSEISKEDGELIKKMYTLPISDAIAQAEKALAGAAKSIID